MSTEDVSALQREFRASRTKIQIEDVLFSINQIPLYQSLPVMNVVQNRRPIKTQKQEVGQNFTIDDAEESKMQEEVPHQMDFNEQEEIPQSNQQKVLSSYYKKLDLLCNSLSKKQVVTNIIEYPIKPNKALARQILELLVNPDVVDKVTKKRKPNPT